MGAGLPSILRWLLWLLRPLWRPRNWGQFGPSFGPDSSFAKQDLAPVMERVNIRAPKSSTVAEHVRLLEKRATTGKAPPHPTHPPCAWQKDSLLPIPLVMSQVGSQVSFSPARPRSVRVLGVEIFSSGTRAAARAAYTPCSNSVTIHPAHQCLKPHVGPGGRGWPPGSGTLSC